MVTKSYDITIVGAGTAGAFSAATAASEGLEVVLIERKSRDEAGHIACGDAIKGKSSLPNVLDTNYLKEESFSNQHIRRAILENPTDGNDLEIEFDTPGTVLNRKRYGEIILEEAERSGADIHFDTVVTDVVQEDGFVTGVKAKRNSQVINYDATVTVDAAGALSILQDKVDFSDTTFDTNVNYSQFCSAYREIVEVPNKVEWNDALVFKPTQELGYLWYFPRTGTEINAGLGFQMNKPPMELIDVLKQDLNSRPEFAGATVKNKLGAALPTRRPYDSAVANGFVAIGDAAGHVNPTTGGGIVAAANSAVWSTKQAIKAISEGDVSESALWKYNREVMTDFGSRFAAADLYNIWGGAHNVEELAKVITALPGKQVVDAIGTGDSDIGLWLKLKLLAKTIGHWGTLYELAQVQEKAKELKKQYQKYPMSPEQFNDWQRTRDSIMDDVYAITNADPKY